MGSCRGTPEVSSDRYPSRYPGTHGVYSCRCPGIPEVYSGRYPGTPGVYSGIYPGTPGVYSGRCPGIPGVYSGRYSCISEAYTRVCTRVSPVRILGKVPGYSRSIHLTKHTLVSSLLGIFFNASCRTAYTVPVCCSLFWGVASRLRIVGRQVGHHKNRTIPRKVPMISFWDASSRARLR